MIFLKILSNDAKLKLIFFAFKLKTNQLILLTIKYTKKLDKNIKKQVRK